MKTMFAFFCAAVAATSALLPHQVLPADLQSKAQYQLYAAYGAYCHEDELKDWDCKWCEKLGAAKVYGVQQNITWDGQVFVIRNNASEIIVSFRGSHNIQNWIADFTFDKVELNWPGVPKGLEVHQGFLESYMSLRKDTSKWVKEATTDCPNCVVHVTGHSLGAAEAVLCVADLRLQGYKPEMWTYGQPRVGTKEFAKWFDGVTASYNQTVYRMVNKKDIVPHLAPSEMFFHHTDREVWRMKNDTYMMCDGSGEDHECSRSIPLVECNPDDHLKYMGLDESCPRKK
eukprot:TRINITY_DN2034_c1_g1_i1.p1 TRINITY_DN2034_c1_g1~~TRINITY_DN2034_c1_g1_i1.p1  ORF type:complete len:286 (+),score=74.46 TRINITY_DN2034_c1_g1_i1:76-933(+)